MTDKIPHHLKHKKKIKWISTNESMQSGTLQNLVAVLNRDIVRMHPIPYRISITELAGLITLIGRSHMILLVMKKI